MSPGRVVKSAIAFRPSSFFRLRDSLQRRKYRRLYSSKTRSKPGPKGPSSEVIDAIIEFKRRNPRCGGPRIAQQISNTFGIEILPYVVRRILAIHYKPNADSNGPSWLTFLGHSKDSLWSMDLFRCETATLKTHWVLGVMDQFTRRIIGSGIQPGDVDGQALCRIFNKAISASGQPRYLSSDNDPLFNYHQ